MCCDWHKSAALLFRFELCLSFHIRGMGYYDDIVSMQFKITGVIIIKSCC